MRLCGPMQSWGTRSRFTERDTEMEPSKSGVIGLVCAALGRPRSEPVDDLAGLRMGVRVDHEGTMARDYHTAGGGPGGGVARAGGGTSRDAVLSNRYYLADADFLVGLEGDEPGLVALETALRAPVWQLALGRKSFVPSIPVYLPGGGLRPARLEEALSNEAWPLVPLAWRRPPGETPRLRLVLETTFDDPNHEVRMDQPHGAAFRDRTFGPRAIVQTIHLTPKEGRDVPQSTQA